MLDAQMKRGLIENCVLAATARGDSYGYKIVKDLSGCVNVTESTLYPILRRLESAGCLTVYSVEHSGRLWPGMGLHCLNNCIVLAGCLAERGLG